MVILATTLLALEGLVRLAAPRAMMVPWADDIQGVTAPRLLVSGRFAIPDCFDTTITIHDRFRSRPPIAREPAPGTTRIAVLGDSATFGWGSEDHETYPAVLEQLLNARDDNAHRRSVVEVLNAGVIGTGTGEQALWYDLWVRQFKPSVVVLTVYWNDVDDDSRGSFFEVDERSGAVRPRPLEVLERGMNALRRTRRIANSTPGFSWLSQHSQLLTWVRQAPTDLFVASHVRAIGGDSNALNRGPSLTAWELARFRGEIRWLRDRVAPSRLAVVFLPSAETFDRTRMRVQTVVGRSDQIVSALQAMAIEDGTPFFDLRQRIGPRSDVKRLYFALDPHPNPAGNQAIAEAVASFLLRERLVASLTFVSPDSRRGRP